MKNCVAIITRTKDRPHLLKRAIQSAACQTHSDWVQVIVNDGGNKEEAERVVREYAAGDQRVILHHNAASVGMQNASNIGINKVKSDFIIIHDDDDSWEPQFLERTVNFLNNPPHPSMEGVVTYSMHVSEKIVGGEIKHLKSTPFNAWFEDVSLFRVLELNTFPPISFLFHRRAYDALGPFEQEWDPLGDWEFNVRFLLKYNIGVIPEILANYHHRVKSTDSQYTNSVNLNAPYRSHKFYENLLRNHWLRKDIADGTLSLGGLSAVSEKLGQTWTNSYIIKDDVADRRSWLSKLKNMVKRSPQ